DFPDVGGTVNNDRTVVLRRDLFRQCRRHRCGEVANDLLENIFLTLPITNQKAIFEVPLSLEDGEYTMDVKFIDKDDDFLIKEKT
ncbi:hypothetical protein MJN54_33645, partial [Salmonella enterica subsp. enterica serovar Kentucky]|nr:hypothetical protein [Salmonella enterica subsp. enterica serovar Kentucky]